MPLLQTVETVAKAAVHTVGMGQTVLLQGHESASTVLGSCIGLALFHRRLDIAAFAHIVLPAAEGRSGSPGKFADTAIPHMLDLLAKENAAMGLQAKIAGGAHMFACSGPLKIGDSNIAAVKEILTQRNIPIISECLGGPKGRRVTFQCESRDFVVTIAGNPATSL